MKELIIGADVENLPTVIDFIDMGLEKADCPMKIKSQINLAVEEIFVNISSYAYAPGTGKAVIRLLIDTEITIEFEDSGIPYNPLEKDDPDISLSMEDKPIGGLGIFMVKQIMDSVEYIHRQGKNVLTIKKTI